MRLLRVSLFLVVESGPKGTVPFGPEPEYRGVGLGRQLLATAMEYCKRQKYKQVYLWTIQDLKAARHLYESFGFSVTEQSESDTWKSGVIEERWDMILNN